MATMGNLSRIMSGPPNIPADRLKALRTAFRQAMASKKLRDAAKRAKRGIEPAYGDEVQKMVVDLMVQPPEIVAMLKKLSTLKDDLIAHTGPVTKTKPFGKSQKPRTTSGKSSCSKLNILLGIVRMTAPVPFRSKKRFIRKRESDFISCAKSASCVSWNCSRMRVFATSSIHSSIL